MIWYGTEKRHNNIELDLAMSIDTGETRSSNEGIVEWLEEKARRAVKDEFGLDDQQGDDLVIKADVSTER